MDNNQSSGRGFTVAELLMVLTLISILVAISLPAFHTLRSTYGRRVALGEITRTLEQAREAAIEYQVCTYVLFPDDRAPHADLKFRAVAIYRDPIKERGETTLQPLTSWRFLPNGICFQPDTTSVYNNGPVFHIPILQHDTGDYPAIVFNETGSIDSPLDSPLQISFCHGYLNWESGAYRLIHSSKPLGSITLARTTGKSYTSELEIAN